MKTIQQRNDVMLHCRSGNRALQMAMAAGLTLGLGSLGEVMGDGVVRGVTGLVPEGIGVGQELAAGSALSTGEGGHVQVEMGGATNIRLGSDTDASLLGGSRVGLESGVALIDVESGLFKKGEVRTPEHKVTARGLLLISYQPEQFLKVTCLSGSARVDLESKFGEYVELEPGDTLITTPADRVLPDPVKVEIAHLVSTSKLINDPGLPPLSGGAGLAKAIERQQRAVGRGDADVTPLVLTGDNRLLLDVARAMQQAQRLEEAPELDAEVAVVDREEPAGGGGLVGSDFAPLPAGFREVALSSSQSLLRTADGSSGPPSMKDPKRLVLESGSDVVLNPAGVYDITSLARLYGAIGSSLNLTVVSRVVTTGNVSRLELYAGQDLIVAETGEINVRALEEWEEVYSYEGGESGYGVATGLVLYAQKNLGVKGKVTNLIGPIELIGDGSVVLDGAALRGVGYVDIYSGGAVTLRNSSVLVADDTWDSTYTSATFYVYSGGEVVMEGMEVDARDFYVNAPSVRGRSGGAPNRVKGGLSMNGVEDINGLQVTAGLSPRAGGDGEGEYISVNNYEGAPLVIRNSSMLRNVSDSAHSGIFVTSEGGISIRDSRLMADGANGEIFVENGRYTGPGGPLQILDSNLRANARIAVSQYTPNGELLIRNSRFDAGQHVDLYSNGRIRFEGANNFTSPNTILNSPQVIVEPGSSVTASGNLILFTELFQNLGSMTSNGGNPKIFPDGHFLPR